MSRDLIAKGLTRRTEVEEEWLGSYLMLDKMNKRWTDEIDILMAGQAEVQEWGKQTVTIHWQAHRETP